MPDVSRTRHTFRRAEFGFFGVMVYTRVHTPRRCGDPARAIVLLFFGFGFRPCRTSCCTVGTSAVNSLSANPHRVTDAGFFTHENRRRPQTTTDPFYEPLLSQQPRERPPGKSGFLGKSDWKYRHGTGPRKPITRYRHGPSV